MKRTAAGVIFLVSLSIAADWPAFRGPNGSGVAPDANLPLEFGPAKNVVWKTSLPPGHSSPVVVGDKIFLTAHEGEKLLTIALDRSSGRVLWRREAPRSRTQKLHEKNSPASPSVATDGRNAYVFFTDFGLLSYGPDGEERWRHPLPPFNNPFGQGASPVISGNTLLQSCDQEIGSYFLALDKDTGKRKWRVERPEYTRGFSTPPLWKGPDGRMQVLVPGSYRLVALDVETGREIWFTSGLTWQLKPTPVLDGERIYVLGWAGEADPGQQEQVPSFEETAARIDKDKDGKLSKEELIGTIRNVERGWVDLDLDADGFLGARDWAFYQSKRSVVNGINAIKLGGNGDMTATNHLWRYSKSLPNVPSPLLYEGVLYMIRDGAILTALDPKTGEPLKVGRLADAPGSYYSSPIAAGGRIYTLSEEGKLSVIRAGRDWEVLATHDFNESCHATPAIADGKMYVRTHSVLYCFARHD
jgi:outer membrane protein assembly factor BamB